MNNSQSENAFHRQNENKKIFIQSENSLIAQNSTITN